MYDLLESHYHVFAPTLRGMGLSQRVDSYPMPPYIEDTGKFIRQVVGAPVLGVAHSAGAWFGLGAAVTDGDLFSAFVSLDQALDPLATVKFLEKDEATYLGMLGAARKASDVNELVSLLAEVPASSGDALGDVLSDEELAVEAAEWDALDPEIMGPWADDGLESWIMIPEFDAWPGAYGNPLLFIDADPEAGGLTSRGDVEYNLERYPWAERIEMTGHDHSLRLSDDPGPVVDHIRRFFGKI
jgi:pimeloyl-ACP methyl ester carboxylesterase